MLLKRQHHHCHDFSNDVMKKQKEEKFVTSANGWRHKKSFLWRQPLTISICPSFTSTDEANLARIARLDGVDFLTMCDESLETHPIHWVFQLLLNLRSVKLDNVSASVVGAIDMFQRLSQNCPNVKFYFLDWFSCMH
jgi:hypothetical protein